jgi:hypothetical protein
MGTFTEHPNLYEKVYKPNKFLSSIKIAISLCLCHGHFAETWFTSPNYVHISVQQVSFVELLLSLHSKEDRGLRRESFHLSMSLTTSSQLNSRCGVSYTKCKKLKRVWHKIFDFKFFMYQFLPCPWVFPWGPCRIFSKIRGDIQKYRFITGVATVSSPVLLLRAINHRSCHCYQR